MAPLSILLVCLVASLLFTKYFLDSLLVTPLRSIPGPKAFALTKWRLAFEDWKGTRTHSIYQLHLRYGPVVRIGPNEISFNTLSALRTIYGPGSRYGRTDFYRMFDVYGHQNLFTFHSAAEHGQRKKLLSHAYSKTSILKHPVASIIEAKVRDYMDLIRSEPGNISDIFSTLHYYSLDNITAFLYGKYGSTFAIQGSESDQVLIGDILDPARRRLSWLTVHFPGFTKWLYTRKGVAESLVQPLLPMRKPATYTGIRKFALQAYWNFRSDMRDGKKTGHSEESSIVGRLWKYHTSQDSGRMDDLDIASECADHFLAGIDTTSDTLMFLIWSLSQPRNKVYQKKLIAEVLGISQESLNDHGLPRVEVADKCIYLDAIIKETLRLYTPLPSYEPRSMPVEWMIDGYTIPPNTVVGMSPYSMHRNPDIFDDPLVFNPDRWLGPRAVEMNRWFWAFSSGGRMCIGLHLAMAEMTTLSAAIYRTFETSLAPGFEDTTPGITARFELFYDVRFPKVMEHRCLIQFADIDA